MCTYNTGMIANQGGPSLSNSAPASSYTGPSSCFLPTHPTNPAELMYPYYTNYSHSSPHLTQQQFQSLPNTASQLQNNSINPFLADGVSSISPALLGGGQYMMPSQFQPLQQQYLLHHQQQQQQQLMLQLQMQRRRSSNNSNMPFQAFLALLGATAIQQQDEF